MQMAQRGQGFRPLTRTLRGGSEMGAGENSVGWVCPAAGGIVHQGSQVDAIESGVLCGNESIT